MHTVRIHARDTIHHVTARFIDHQFFTSTADARVAYLDRVERFAKKTDCRLLAYAVMSNHMHWVVLTADDPVRRFIHPLDVSFARWVNRRHDRIGPVFANRYHDEVFVGPTALPLIAYVHNNPVRARVVENAIDSDWTSHHAYVGLSAKPRWLDVNEGLRICGFEATEQHAFAAAVESARGETLDVRHKDAVARLRSRVRATTGVALELSDSIGGERGLFVRPQTPMPVGMIDVGECLGVVVALTGISVPMLLSRAKLKPIVFARRVAAYCWSRMFRRSQSEMAAALGISSSTMSWLCQTGDAMPDVADLASQVATRIVTIRGNEKRPNLG